MNQLPLDQIVCGDALEVMREWPDGVIDCVMTSPPYYGLRDYKANGQIGLEATPVLYIERLMVVFKEVKRVLKPSGSLFINIGDAYGGSQGRGKGKGNEHGQKISQSGFSDCLSPKTTKSKCLLGIPWRLALAMIDDGWILRNEVVWAKTNAMPSSVKDRLANTHEKVFHFVKSHRYFYDLDAIREPVAQVSIERKQRGISDNNKYSDAPNYMSGAGQLNKPRPNRNKTAFEDYKQSMKNAPEPGEPNAFHPLGKNPGGKNPGGKNPGDVWRLSTQSFAGAHFATFPEKLCLKPILATCPQWICIKCGLPRVRITKTDYKEGLHWRQGKEKYAENTPKDNTHCGPQGMRYGRANATHETIGWTDCGCGEPFEPGIVLDPFAGAGTACLMAKKLGRHYIGIDIKPDYVEMARRRIDGIMALI